MSDDDEKDDLEDGESKTKQKQAPKQPQQANSISSISAKLDDLTFSLGMAFPSFGLNAARSSSYQTRDVDGGRD